MQKITVMSLLPVGKNDNYVSENKIDQFSQNLDSRNI